MLITKFLFTLLIVINIIDDFAVELSISNWCKMINLPWSIEYERQHK